MTEAATPYQIPKEPGRWRALLLAALVHLLLVGFLWFGIRWQNVTPPAVEAEVWDIQVKEAAPPPPPPVEVKPEPRPEPKPEPKPEPRPEPKPAPQPKVVTPPVPRPDIALEQEKKRKEAEQRAEHERQEKLAEQKRQEKLAEQKRQEKLAEQKRQEKLAEQKRLAEEKKREEEAKRRKQEEEQKKLAAEKQRKKEQEAAAARDAEQRHLENVRRLQAQAGGSGEAPKAQGPRSADPSYAQKVAARIKSNTTFSVPEGLAGNPSVEYDVQLLPDGSVRGMRKTRSSGVPGFDEAVARAIERSQPFPPDRGGAVPGSFTLSHRPKDQ